MDAARQVLRFSIPGSVLLLLTYSFIIGGRLLQHDSLDNIAQAVNQNVAGIVAILASIPVGFILYQFYYLSFQPFVRVGSRFGRRWPRIDRGARVLSILDVDELTAVNRLFGVSHATALEGRDEMVDAPPVVDRSTEVNPISAEVSGTIDAKNWPEYFGVQRLSPSFLSDWSDIDPDSPFKDMDAYKKAAVAYEERWYDNWDVLRAMLEAAVDFPGGSELKSEYVVLSDVYHALGACRTACSVAWLSSAVVVAVCLFTDPGTDLLRSILSIVLAGGVSSLLWLVLNQTRRQTWKSAEKSLVYGLRYFLTRNPGFLEPGHQ